MRQDFPNFLGGPRICGTARRFQIGLDVNEGFLGVLLGWLPFSIQNDSIRLWDIGGKAGNSRTLNQHQREQGGEDYLHSRTPELTDAGGQWHPNWKLTWPARVRSSDLVRRSHLFFTLPKMLCLDNPPQNRLSKEFVVLSPTRKYASAAILYG